MQTGEQIQEQIASGLRAVLSEVPFLRIRSTKFDARTPSGPVDLALDVSINKSPWRLLVEIKSSGEPRIARGAIQQILTIASKQEGQYGLFAAPYIGPDTQKICKELGAGFVDLAGNCRLVFDKTFIERRGLPNPKVERRPLRTLFSPKASRVLRVMFESPKQFWQVQRLAREARVSLGLAAKVKQRLLDLEYAREEREGILLAKPEDLLRAWATALASAKMTAVGIYAPGDPPQIEEDLRRFCINNGIRYALTQFSGAARVAPFTRYNRGSAYVDGDPQILVDKLSWKAVDTGAIFTLPWPFDEGVWYGVQQIDQDWVASDVQLFLDLMQSKGRGEEAAGSILEQRLRPRW
jgi:hypothetical protein